MFFARMKASLEMRAVDWLLALITFSWGGRLLIGGPLPALGSYDFLLSIASQDVWGLACLVGGAVRLAVLVINGFWTRSPHVLSLLSFLTLLFWSIITYGFIEAGALGTAAAVYPWLLVFELRAALVAAKQAAIIDMVGAARWREWRAEVFSTDSGSKP